MLAVIKAAGAPWVRECVWGGVCCTRPMSYSATKGKTRATGAGGGVAYSLLYNIGRGGCQGSVPTPLLFVVLMHYVYQRHDDGRAELIGPGEQHVPDHEICRCQLCRKLFPIAEYVRAGAYDGHCRGCQIVRATEDQSGCAEQSTPTPLTRAQEQMLVDEANTLEAVVVTDNDGGPGSARRRTQSCTRCVRHPVEAR